MKTGIFWVNVASTGTEPAVVARTAECAERLGFSTLWAPEHVVLFDRQNSKYPYSRGGEFIVPGDSNWYDPFILLAYAAAVTSTIRLATGISLVPEHNPLVLAKEIASLDRLSGGRFALGVGVGWSADEFRALGLPFERRAKRTRECIEAMRRLWGDEVSSFKGEFVNFESVRSYPKPVSGARLPILFGGEVNALKRTAEYGDGWYGFCMSPGRARGMIDKLRALARERGRDPEELEIAVAPDMDPDPPYSLRLSSDDLKRYHELGVDEIVILMSVPEEESEVAPALEEIARRWLEPAARLG